MYYQTLSKSLILLLIQLMARARTGPRHVADPPPFMGMGPIRLLHQNNKRGPGLALDPFLPPSKIKHLYGPDPDPAPVSKPIRFRSLDPI